MSHCNYYSGKKHEKKGQNNVFSLRP